MAEFHINKVDKLYSESTVTENNYHSSASERTSDPAPIGPIFVSHSHSDGEIVGALLELLGASADIQRGEILATSQSGMTIPGGVKWADYLRDRLKDTPLVIVVITENYLRSSFCMVELGALWVLGKDLVPLLLPPLTAGDLKHVLSDIQVMKLDSDNLAQARRRVAAVLDEPVTNEESWTAADEQFRQKVAAVNAAQSSVRVLEAGS